MMVQIIVMFTEAAFFIAPSNLRMQKKPNKYKLEMVLGLGHQILLVAEICPLARWPAHAIPHSGPHAPC